MATGNYSNYVQGGHWKLNSEFTYIRVYLKVHFLSFQKQNVAGQILEITN